MGNESSTYGRTILGARGDVAEETRSLSSASPKVEDGRLVFKCRPTKKGGMLANKKQLPEFAPALVQLRSVIAVVAVILSLSQGEGPTLAKDNAIAHARPAKARHRGRRYRTILPNTFKRDQVLTPAAGPKVGASPLYVIKASPGKGLGMFATRNIQKGTRILAEKPFFSLAERPEIDSSDPYAPNDIVEAFDRLPVSERRKYMSLHCPDRDDCSLVVSIYEANSHEMGLGTCICLDASRINHSCIPNSHYSWNSDLRRETVHAVKDIGIDEEITISYCPANRTLKKRKRDLKSYFFACSCPACQTNTYFGIWSRIRRQQMRDLDHEIADYQNDLVAAQEEYGHPDEESAIMRLVTLNDEEGLVFENSRAYHDAAECALKRGLRGKALDYASKELDLDLCCVGRDSPFYKETISFFLKIYSGGDDYGSGAEVEDTDSCKGHY